MRQFFITLMGTLAGIWLSITIAVLGSIILFGAMAASFGSSSGTGTTVEKSSILVIDLATSVEERQTPIGQFTGLLGESDVTPIALDVFASSLRHASTDKNIVGVVLECGGISAGMAQCQEMLKVLNEFKESGKWIYAYGDTYTQADYYLASCSDSIFVNPVGTIDIHGLSSTTMFFKGLLDKLGIEAQVVKVGTYKSAVEPFILTEMSHANAEQQRVFLNSIWKTIATQIADGRELTYEKINALADSSCYAKESEFYLKNALADGVYYRHEFDDMLAKRTGQDKARKVSLSAYSTLNNITVQPLKAKKTIAVLYAVGDITDTEGDGIVASELVPQIFKLAEDDKVDGLILRVNSGGGSAFASEQIWEALHQYKSITNKPFFVSMSDYAASGGYYISCGADRIYAEPTTLTGSIGIFGIIPQGETFLSKHLGITTGTVSTNPEGLFPSFFRPMTASQRKALQKNVENGYELFVQRCATGRNMPVDSIKAIAEGRVWDGQTALNIGLVDHLGGLDDAIADMTSQLNEEKCRIVNLPDLELDFKQELRKALFNLKATLSYPGCSVLSPYTDAVERFCKMNNIQCRMEFLVVE